MSAPESLPPIDNGLLRFITCGSVDDGKSTLIGRLLFDSKAILADTLHAIESTSVKRGLSAADLSLLTDGLQAEREQGITIDVAYRYFSTGTRKYIIGDAPGHEQYTRNMVTAASTANLAIVLIDARSGVVTQTRRHSAIIKLLGIPHVIVAVNKMDLVDYDEGVFRTICANYHKLAAKIGLTESATIDFIPMSALQGDMVVERGARMPWYKGATLMRSLESVPAAHSEHGEAFRFPVQYVCRPQASTDPALHDFRGFMGRVESGRISKGDAVTVLPSGAKSRIQDIRVLEQSLPDAVAEQSVTLLLDDDVDISRGDMIVKSDEPAEVVRDITATLCWLSETALVRARKYLLRAATREVRAMVSDIEFRLNMNTLDHETADTLGLNDIASARIKLAQPIVADRYADNRATGAFILVDEASNDTVAAGMIA